jgi:hypothetical protein
LTPIHIGGIDGYAAFNVKIAFQPEGGDTSLGSPPRSETDTPSSKPTLDAIG